MIAVVIAVALAYYMAQTASSSANDATGGQGDNGNDGNGFATSDMNISPAGLALIQQFEGTKTDANGNYVAYKDSTGTWTIGFGHTAGVQPGQVIDAATAQSYLLADVQTAVAVVQSKVTAALSQPQFDALVSFAFNVGAGNFAGSTLVAMTNAGNLSGAVAQFGAWVYSKGQVLSGLIARRAAESALFAGLA